MARSLTIDASVLVSALCPTERRHQDSLRFLETLRDHPRLVILPTLVKPEIAGALDRLTGDSELALDAAALAFLPAPFVLVDLDHALADDAAQLAVRANLRGGDAVYAATARRFDALLVTLDGEQRARLPDDVAAIWPWEVGLD